MEEIKKEDLEITIKKLVEQLNKKKDIFNILNKKSEASCTIKTVTYTAHIKIEENKTAITNI